MQKYQLVHELGNGAFGAVMLYKNLQTRELVAVKVMRQRYDDWQ